MCVAGRGDKDGIHHSATRILLQYPNREEGFQTVVREYVPSYPGSDTRLENIHMRESLGNMKYNIVHSRVQW